MHGTMDNDSIRPFEMRLGNAANVIGVVGIRKALVMDDHIESFEPLRVFIELDGCLGPFSAFVDNGPVDRHSSLFRGQLHRFALKIVVVATAPRDQQDRDVFVVRFWIRSDGCGLAKAGVCGCDGGEKHHPGYSVKRRQRRVHEWTRREVGWSGD